MTTRIDARSGGGEFEPRRQNLLQMKDGMKTTSANLANDKTGPLLSRIVRKWYSWAGMGLATTAAYLAIDGQLKLDGSNLLKAAAPSDIAWQANPEAPETLPAPKERHDIALPDPVMPPTSVHLPDVVAIPEDKAVPLIGTKLSEVLNNYVKADDALLVKNEEAPAIPAAKIPLPPVPPDRPPTLPPAEDVKTVEPIQVAPELVAPKLETPVLVTPVLVLPPNKLEVSAEALPEKVETEKLPAIVGPDKKVPEGEPIPTKPRVEGSSNSALAAEVESLKQNESLLYEAAQNYSRMKDFPKAREVFEQLLQLRPDLLYIRAEYAGILVSAGELQRAVELYKKIVEMKPESMLYRIRLGDTYVIGKDYKSAIRVYAEALRNPPYEPEYAVRLARAYTFDNDFNHAFMVYDRMLAGIKPEDPKAPVALGALLLDLDMPFDAMPYLLAKRKQIEKDPRHREITLLEVLASLVRAHSRLGERQLAMDVIAELPTVAIEQIGVRETLANQLFSMEEYELAAQVFNQVLQLEPTNGNAIIGMARVYLEMAQPMLARQILDSFRPAPRQMRDYLATYAVYHQRVGEYIEANQIYMDMLRRNENDHETRLSLGMLHDLAEGKDQWERAKAEYAKIPPLDRAGRNARRSFADALSHQRKFQEALEIDRQLLMEDPCDYLTIAFATRHYSKAGMHDQAIALARGFLATSPRSEGHGVAVRMALGRALLDAGRYLDAIREYEILISRPSGRDVEAYYGLIRAHEKLGNADRAKQFLACMAGLPGGEYRNRLALATLYYADYEDRRVIEICLSLLNQDPRHLPTLIRLVDSQQRLSRFTGQPADVFQTAQGILTLSQTNFRGHMAMARSFAVAQNFRKACGQYDQLIQLDPEQRAPRLERARCLYADKQYSAARSSREQLQKPTADDALITDINDVVTRNPKMAAFLQPYIVSGIAGPGLRKELGRLAVSIPDPELRLAIHRLVCDYDARVARHEAVRLEEEAMELKDYRPWSAIVALQGASQFEPTNTETLFGLGQQFSALAYTQRAIDAYGAVLAVDPTHRDSMVASSRASAEMSPKLDLSGSYFWQQGRQGLADITRYRETAAGRVPLGDETEYLQFGYTAAQYKSRFNYPEAEGNLPFMRVQKRLDDLTLLYGQINVEQFKNGFKTRPTFDVGTIYQFCEWASFRGGAYLENVAENGETIRQDIYRYGIYTGADFRPTRIWAFGGQYQYGHYSDNNDMNNLTLYNELALTPPPKMLKLAERFYYWGYREQTVFPTNPPDPANIFGAIHPYFAPANYSQMELRVEWWHWLSRDYFAHSNQCWYSLQYGIMTDSNLVVFHNLRAIFNYDVCTWMSVGAAAQAQLSSVYNMFTALGYLQIRFN